MAKKSTVRNFSIEDRLWKQVKAKAKTLTIPVSASAVIRALLKKWVKGEIEL